MTKDDRPLHVLASRAATYLFKVPLLDAPPGYPEDKRLRAIRVEGVVLDEEHRENVGVWLDFGRGLDGGKSWQLVALDGKGFRRVLIEGRSPAAFRAAFDATERALEGAEALRPWRVT